MSKIEISKQEGAFRAQISGKIEGWMIQTILGWNIVWSLCGLAVLYYLLFMGLSKEEMLFMFIFLCFWAVFALKGWRAFFFKSKGYELIKISERGFELGIKVFSKEHLQTLPLKSIKSIKRRDGGKSYSDAFDKSYWSMGGQRILIETDTKTYPFGIQLSDTETTQLINSLKRAINKKY